MVRQGYELKGCLQPLSVFDQCLGVGNECNPGWHLKLRKFQGHIPLGRLNSSKEDLPDKLLASEQLIKRNKRQLEKVLFSCVFLFLRFTYLILR